MTWSVYLQVSAPDAHTLTLDSPENAYAVVDAITADLAEHAAVIGVGERVLSAQACVEATDASTAVRALSDALRASAAKHRFPTGAAVEMRVLPWATFETETHALPDLVSGAEAALMLGVTRQRVHQLATMHPRFPRPVYELGVGKLWLRAGIVAFAASWERKPGRPALVAARG